MYTFCSIYISNYLSINLTISHAFYCCIQIISGSISWFFYPFVQRTLTYFIRGTITVWLTTCLTGLDLAKQVNMLLIKHKQSNWIKTSQIGGLMYSDTSPYKVHGLNIWVETFASCWKSQSCETFQTFNPLYFLILIVEQCNSGFGLLQLVAFNDFTLQKLW